MAPLRTIEFDKELNAHILRDTRASVHAILHLQEPFPASGATARDGAEEYLRAHAATLGINDSELTNLHLFPDDPPSGTDVEYRFLSEKRQFDVTTVTFQQTKSGLPVWKAGIAVHLKQQAGNINVVCAQTARDTDINSPGPVAAAEPPLMAHRHVAMAPGQPAQLPQLDEKSLAQSLGIASGETPFDVKSLQILHRRPMMYRYSGRNLSRALQAMRDDKTTAHPFAIPLPTVSPDIKAGEHHAVTTIYFDLAPKGHAPYHWIALVEPQTLSILHLDVLAGGIKGLVFLGDPATTHGGPAPSAPNEELKPLRVSAELRELNDPEDGNQALTGRNIKIINLLNPPIRPPAIPPLTDFNFEVRSDDFAAVNAYYNCDRFFRLVEDLGFKRDDYFPGTQFPIPVDHRGNVASLDGLEINARCVGTTKDGPHKSRIGGIARAIFCLAEVRLNPHVGNACDWRVVLHELGGHGPLQSHVNDSHLGFAHSPGDSLAAILNDPESKAADPGSTFPWTPLGRRHDRDVRNGWSWDGEKDIGDDAFRLQAEQILSSTHFRLYQSLGGGADKSEVAVRHRAARITTYLILRAIQSLTPVTKPRHASDWLCNLLVADSEDWASEKLHGGAYEKVIRWAFEKQGLFGGAPPDIDVYIDDGRHGEYCYLPDHTDCQAIWNRHQKDGDAQHQAPAPNVINYAYVKIMNRGSKPATSVVVEAFQNAQAGLVYPDDWKPMETPRLTEADLPARSREKVVGPFEWTPSGAGDNFILMAVSALGDRSNLHKFGIGRSICDSRLVPHDNNLALRKV